MLKSQRIIKTLFIVVIIAVICCIAIYVWPTSLRYDHADIDGNEHLIRINRFTGVTDILYNENGWKRIDKTWDSTGLDRVLLINDKSLLYPAGTLTLKVYNSTGCEVSEIEFIISIRDKNSNKLIDDDKFVVYYDPSFKPYTIRIKILETGLMFDKDKHKFSIYNTRVQTLFKPLFDCDIWMSPARTLRNEKILEEWKKD